MIGRAKAKQMKIDNTTMHISGHEEHLLNGNCSGLAQELLVVYRHALAFLKGAAFGFVMEDLRKERTQDSKLSVEETIALCEQVGFRNPRLIWQTYQGTAGVFYMEK